MTVVINSPGTIVKSKAPAPQGRAGKNTLRYFLGATGVVAILVFLGLGIGGDWTWEDVGIAATVAAALTAACDFLVKGR